MIRLIFAVLSRFLSCQVLASTPYRQLPFSDLSSPRAQLGFSKIVQLRLFAVLRIQFSLVALSVTFIPNANISVSQELVAQTLSVLCKRSTTSQKAKIGPVHVLILFSSAAPFTRRSGTG